MSRIWAISLGSCRGIVGIGKNLTGGFFELLRFSVWFVFLVLALFLGF